MPELWRGFTAFQKPAAVSAVDWDTAMAALRDDADLSTMYAPFRNGDTTIVEGIWNLTKLNTVNLSAITSIDMTDAWEPLRPYQSYARSLEKRASLIADRGWNLNGYTQFVPASAAIADVQAAIALAVANGEGEVDCTGLAVTLVDSGTVTGAMIGAVHYGLLVDGDNVGIKGGTFALSATEEYTSPYVAILFTNLDGTSGFIGNTGPWMYNNWIRGATIVGTALSDAERLLICNNHTAYTLTFNYCQDWWMRDITVVDGWAGNAVLGSQASSRYGYVLECDVQSGVSYIGSKWPYWFDGARYVALMSSRSAMVNAFTFQSNLDNTTPTDDTGINSHNIAVNNVFDNLDNATGRVAISITGSDDTAIISNALSGGNFWGIKITPSARLNAGICRSIRAIIKGNTFTTVAASQRPIILTGLTDNPQTADVTDPVNLEAALIQDNVFVGFTRRGYFDNQYCTGAVFSGNTYPEATTLYGYASAGDEAAIVANNTLQ